jgi:hypothetical protein
MEIKNETKVKEAYEWVFGSGPGAPREVWIGALRNVATYWEENPHLGTPAYVTLRTDRDFDGPTKLRMEVEWNALKTSASTASEVKA